MTTLLRRSVSRLSDAAPRLAAQTKRLIHQGPSFRRSGLLWLVEDDTGHITMPSLRRYGMYAHSVKARIDFMLERYPLGDLKGTLVIDVGAHIGEFAMAAAPLARKVICFEPDPTARQALKFNTSTLRNVEIIPIALSNEDKTSRFFLATDKAGSSLLEPETYSRIIEVEARRLDGLCLDIEGYERIVLKIDAENSEPGVLEGAGEWLTHLDAASVDVAPKHAGANTRHRVKQLLQAAGLHEAALTPDQVLVMRRR